MRTMRAIQSCARWLAFCISIGWTKYQLDALEETWWKFHDDHGNLVTPKEPA